MTVILRLVCLTGLLLSGIGTAAAAGQGRGDHDTPATQHQSEFGSPREYNDRTCRTDDHGWVVCRDSNGHRWREGTDRRYRKYSEPDDVGDWIWRLLD